MRQKISIPGKSPSLLQNYGRHLAKLAFHFGCVPTVLDPDQINDYLYLIQQEHRTPSDSYFRCNCVRTSLCLPHDGTEGQTHLTAHHKKGEKTAHCIEPGGS